MTDSIRIGNIDELRDAGEALRRVAADLDRDLGGLLAAFDSLGQPWGSDKCGRIIGAELRGILDEARMCLAELGVALGESGVDLAAASEQWRQADEDGRRLVEQTGAA